MRYQTTVYEKFLLDCKPKKPFPPLTHTTYDLEWLMLCQHYGIPTRLLDWTMDILVALYFACASEENKDKDGALFVCNRNEYPAFSTYNKSAMEIQELTFVDTYILNPRMRIQSGTFMIWGHAALDENSIESYDLWEYIQKNNNEYFIKKITIPREAKQFILYQEIISIFKMDILKKISLRILRNLKMIYALCLCM